MALDRTLFQEGRLERRLAQCYCVQVLITVVLRAVILYLGKKLLWYIIQLAVCNKVDVRRPVHLICTR